MAQTEDIDNEVSDFAIPDDDNTTPDPDQNNKSVLIKVSKYLEEKIIEHNSFDAIVPEAENIMSTQQQVQMHKNVVIHLRNIKSEIDTKVERLK